jgi:hypothetical protein
MFILMLQNVKSSFHSAISLKVGKEGIPKATLQKLSEQASGYIDHLYDM